MTPDKTRDPRTDPKPGDVVRNGLTRDVSFSGARTVAWRYLENPGFVSTSTHKTWRKWAKNAEVLHHAD